MTLRRLLVFPCIGVSLAAVVASGFSSTHGGDLPLVDDLVLRRWAAIESEVFGTVNLYSRGVAEQKAWALERTEEAKARRLWYVGEGRSIARLSGDLLEDTEVCTTRRDRLREATEKAARFTQVGVTMPSYRAKFADLVTMTAYRSEVREILTRDIGPVAAGDFVGHKLHGLVSPPGELDPPPPSLLTTKDHIDGAALFRRVRDDWAAVASDIRDGREPSEDRLASLWSACDDWGTFTAGEEHPSPAAVNYPEGLRRLVAVAASPSERDVAGAFLREGGYAFGGGSYGNFMFHVLEHRLYPRAGTPGSIAVAEITQAMVDRATIEIAELDRKLEDLRRKSPAHNAVIRERMVPRYFADKSSAGVHAGLNSPAYRDRTDAAAGPTASNPDDGP